MKKVVVYAYTRFNLGDDLFIKILSERYPKTRFILFAPRKYKVVFKDNKNICVFPNDFIMIRGIDFICRKLNIYNPFRRIISKSCDIAVNIGGSLFIQGENWKNQVKTTKSMRVENRPFFLLGANFGPFNNSDYYANYKDIFKEYTDICFREKYSYDLFKELGNVRMADDIVFQLKKVDSQQFKKDIVISVIKPSVRKQLANYDDIYYEKIKDITICFINKGYKVTLMSFCEKEGDTDAVKEIINLIPKEYLNSVDKYLYKLDIQEALGVIARSSYVIATRFHSMILGLVYNKPVFPIVYSNKMTNVMSDIGFNGSYCDFNSINSLDPEEVFKSLETNLIDISKQVENSEKQFEKLDRYLLN